MQIMSGALYLLNRFQVSSVSFANIDIFFYNSLVSSLRTLMHQLCHVCFKLGCYCMSCVWILHTDNFDKSNIFYILRVCYRKQTESA